MPGLAIAAIAAIAVIGILTACIAVGVVMDRDPKTAAAGREAERRRALAVSSPVLAVALGPWTLAQAGMVSPSAWLTAPRETADFVAQQQLIRDRYARAERKQTAALRRAGMTAKRGWHA